MLKGKEEQKTEIKEERERKGEERKEKEVVDVAHW